MDRSSYRGYTNYVTSMAADYLEEFGQAAAESAVFVVGADRYTPEHWVRVGEEVGELLRESMAAHIAETLSYTAHNPLIVDLLDYAQDNVDWAQLGQRFVNDLRFEDR